MVGSITMKRSSNEEIAHQVDAKGNPNKKKRKGQRRKALMKDYAESKNQ
jgi:hypothetical protein